jgi:gliding motility-associated-like protein
VDLLAVNDTSICNGESILISAVPGYDNYIWNTGSTNQYTSISAPGTYTVSANFTTNNLVINGDFSSGNSGFSSSYLYNANDLWDVSTYTVTTNANSVHSNFNGTGDGNFMVVNGSTTPGTEVWCQDIIVEAETMYNFSSLVASVAEGDLAVLQFSINGEEIGNSFTAPNVINTWDNFNATWFSGAETVSEICIINQNIAGGGNDFGLDDISFTTLCSFSDSIIVESNVANATIFEIDELCESDNPVKLTAFNPGGTWSGDGIINSSLGLFSPGTVGPGTHTVNYTIDGACGNEDTIEISVIGAIVPETELYHQICFGDMVNLNTGESNFTEYSWSNGLTSSNINVGTSGTYIATLVDYNQCVQELEFIVVDKDSCENIIMPNVFTPNDDSKNDLFVPIIYKHVPSSTLKIYNRWGAEIYYSQFVLEGWNGEHFSEDCPEGIYYWVLEYQTNKGYHHTLTGHVTLLR